MKSIKKFFLPKNAAALCTLFFETCNCARFRAISYVMKNADGSIEEPLALLAFRRNQSYRTVVRLRIDFDEISLHFLQPEISCILF